MKTKTAVPLSMLMVTIACVLIIIIDRRETPETPKSYTTECLTGTYACCGESGSICVANGEESPWECQAGGLGSTSCMAEGS